MTIFREAYDQLWRICYKVGFPLARIWWFFSKPEHSGALVAIWFGDQLLAVRQSYRTTLCLPGGGICRGEKPSEAASRELREELGLEVNSKDLKLRFEYTGWSDFRRSHLSIFELLLPSRPALEADGREILEAKFWDISSLLTMTLDPLILIYLQDIQKHEYPVCNPARMTGQN